MFGNLAFHWPLPLRSTPTFLDFPGLCREERNCHRPGLLHTFLSAVSWRQRAGRKPSKMRAKEPSFLEVAWRTQQQRVWTFWRINNMGTAASKLDSSTLGCLWEHLFPTSCWSYSEFQPPWGHKDGPWVASLLLFWISSDLDFWTLLLQMNTPSLFLLPHPSQQFGARFHHDAASIGSDCLGGQIDSCSGRCSALLYLLSQEHCYLRNHGTNRN